MSYCRWSSQDFSCDVYAYEHVAGGWTIHLAGNRVVGDIPPVPAFPPQGCSQDEVAAWAKEYATASAVRHSFLMGAERVDIDLPHAGESFDCQSLEEFRAKMLELREIGYRFPDSVFDQIDEEMREQHDAEAPGP